MNSRPSLEQIPGLIRVLGTLGLLVVTAGIAPALWAQNAAQRAALAKLGAPRANVRACPRCICDLYPMPAMASRCRAAASRCMASSGAIWAQPPTTHQKEARSSNNYLEILSTFIKQRS